MPCVLVHMARLFSAYRSGSPAASSGEDTAITECQHQMFVVDRSAGALLRLASGHLWSRRARSSWLPSTVVGLSDRSDRRPQLCRIAAPVNFYTRPKSKFCFQAASFGPPVQHLAISVAQNGCSNAVVEFPFVDR